MIAFDASSLPAYHGAWPRDGCFARIRARLSSLRGECWPSTYALSSSVREPAGGATQEAFTKRLRSALWCALLVRQWCSTRPAVRCVGARTLSIVARSPARKACAPKLRSPCRRIVHAPFARIADKVARVEDVAALVSQRVALVLVRKDELWAAGSARGAVAERGRPDVERERREVRLVQDRLHELRGQPA